MNQFSGAPQTRDHSTLTLDSHLGVLLLLDQIILPLFNTHSAMIQSPGIQID